MNISKWNPMNPWEDFDKMVEGMMPARMVRNMRAFMPAVDVYQDKANVIVEMPVTHIDPEQVEISIKDGVLHVKGSTEKKTEVDEKNYYRREISSGSFYRAIPLPADVVSEKTSAIHEDGVLKITMPRTKEKKGKEIKVVVKKGKAKKAGSKTATKKKKK